MNSEIHENIGCSSNSLEAEQNRPSGPKTVKHFNRKRKEMQEKERRPIDKKLLEKYFKGANVEVQHLRRGLKQHHFRNKEEKYKEAEQSCARAEILLAENAGLLEAKETSFSAHITQREIRQSVDITAATKSFDLHLTKLGPYKFRYTNDGRHMVLGGRKGHLASFDWVTKALHFETNTLESIHDVCFLHTEQMMAAAQKEWTYIYDNKGTELHCLKRLNRVLKLEFLPYHFLLCASNDTGYLSWLDVTLGEEIIRCPTRKGPIGVMCQNPSNAVLCCGHQNGTVTMWTPNSKEAVLSMLCHPQSLTAITIDPTGRYLATACVDRLLRIWDTRNLGEVVGSYRLSSSANNLAFSQKQLLSVSQRNFVEVYKDVTKQDECHIYMRHSATSPVTGMQFCPYEDVLGCSTCTGFSSLLIPGAGEPNFDALEANPFKSGAGRREAEVKAVLEKIPSELITVDPATVAQVDVPTLEEKLEVQKQLQWVKVPKIDVQPRYRMKGKSGSAQRFKRKQKVKEAEKRDYYDFIRDKKKSLEEKSEPQEETKPEILDRFKPKRKK